MTSITMNVSKQELAEALEDAEVQKILLEAELEEQKKKSDVVEVNGKFTMSERGYNKFVESLNNLTV